MSRNLMRRKCLEASESEVIRDGLRVLFARDEAVEQWLHTEIVAAYDELRADPSQAVTAQQMRAHLAELHSQHRAKTNTGHAVSPSPSG